MAQEFFALTHSDNRRFIEIVEGREATLKRVQAIVGDFSESSKKTAGRFLEKDETLFDKGGFLPNITLQGKEHNGKSVSVYLAEKK